MKILLVGANSALARVAKPLLAQEHEVVTAGRHGCDMVCDLTKAIDITNGFDVVINFAAAFSGNSDQEIQAAEQTNALGALRLCIAAARGKVKHIIMISSMSAVHERDSPYYSIYAITKRQGDELADFYCGENKIPLTILRPTQIYGDDRSFSIHQPFFWYVVDQASKGEQIHIYGKHDALRNYIHALDLAEIISQVITTRTTGTFGCMYPDDISFSEIAHTAQRVFQKGGEIVFLSDKPDVPDNIFKKDTSIYNKINYRPQISMEEGLKRIKAELAR